jgi:simple sugar transport system ATP-binding protein
MLVESRLELRSITKRYPGIVANDSISLRVMPGEIHAVLGENGAGKSTLMKIIDGAVAADSGEIFWDGAPVTIPSPAAARRLGIGMVHQHFSLFESVSVVENIAVAMSGRFDLADLSRRIRALSDRYGLPVDPARSLHDLSVGERQRVEIIRCLLQSPRLLILDEPTSVLTPQAVRRLFEVLRLLAAEGCGILYISHKLDEIRELCESATILRGGKVVGTADPRRSSAAELARLMVGAEPLRIHRDAIDAEPRPRLEAIGLSVRSDDPFGVDLNDISLAVHGGEIVGIAGVSGNGQAELLSLLSGERLSHADMIQIDRRPVGDLAVADRRSRGLAFVPEERLGRGAVPEMSLADNTLLTLHGAGLVRRGFIDRRGVSDMARGIIARFGVKCGGPDAIARSLSGGNLQKFIIGREVGGREVGLKPRVLIVAQPTWGVDVAAAAFIRQTLIDLSRDGAAVLVISEELEELFEVCDRIAVMYQGRISPAKPRSATSVEEIGLLMAGTGPAAQAAA